MWRQLMRDYDLWTAVDGGGGGRGVVVDAGIASQGRRLKAMGGHGSTVEGGGGCEVAVRRQEVEGGVRPGVGTEPIPEGAGRGCQKRILGENSGRGCMQRIPAEDAGREVRKQGAGGGEKGLCRVF